MNFFEHQEKARRNTGRLVGLFLVAVIGLIVGIYILVMMLFLGGVEHFGDENEAIAQLGPVTFWRPDVLAGVALAVGGVVSAGSLYKTAQLAGGGEPLALSLGGRRILENSSDQVERKVLNVVEEMAIASGLPVPPVYLMDREKGINAFAAGYKPEEAVIGVTRGCVEQLSRDELQGVIAHEFSHILNGDMRLNIRLIAIVHGILLVGLIGYYLLRIAASSGSRRSSNDKGGGTGVFLALGLGLMAVGFAGTLIGNLIKAAVSRQREFLADASAVQFTRNPDGIAGALKQIGGLDDGSKMEASHATEASHMFFASGVRALFATHPPLDERISRIDRFWNAEKAILAKDSSIPSSATPTGTVGFAGGSAASSQIKASSPHPVPITISPDQAVNAIGKPTPQQIEKSHRLLETIPKEVRDAAHEPFGARAVIYALLLDADYESCQKQFEHLASKADPAVHKKTLELHTATTRLPREVRLPLVDICLAPLKDLSASQYARFRENIDALAKADNKLSLFEWTLQKIVFHVLDPYFGHSHDRKPGRPTPDDVAVVMSALAHAGGGDSDVIEAAFRRGIAATGLKNCTLVPWDRHVLNQLNVSLESLTRLPNKSKARLIRGLSETASADGKLVANEIELLRAVATTLDCPMPLVA